jgi:uncharacterized protein
VNTTESPVAVASAPVRPTERVGMVDALRGFALFGVLLANLSDFSLVWAVPDAEKAALPTATWDQTTQFLRDFLVREKFYSLFSLLFGLGFAIQLVRAQERAADFLPTFRRRLWILAAIGLAHLTLLWWGDILLLYALLGFALIAFRGASDRTLLVTAAALLASPILIDFTIMRSGGRLDPGAPFLWLMEAMFERWFGIADADAAVFDLLLDGGLIGLLQWNLPGPLYRIADLLSTNRLPKVFGMFLIGFWLGRRQLFRNIDAHRPLLRRVLISGLALGLPANLGLAYLWAGDAEPFTPLALLQTTALALGVAPLALAYAAGFALLWQRPRWASRLRILAPVGRMALTNYLLQTLIGIGLFFGIGLGLGGKVSTVFLPPLALGIFLLQTGFSEVWLRSFRFGPMEWLWRSLTYRSWQPLRVRPAEPVPEPGGR